MWDEMPGGARLPKDLGPLAEVGLFRRRRTILDRRACRAVARDVPTIQTRSHHISAARQYYPPNVIHPRRIAFDRW
jgi:hypothetical protein